MVVRVRQAMIVPLSVQGGANGCKVASHLQSSRDLCLRSAAMEKKVKGGVENGKKGGHDVGLSWQRAASESSLSSADSLPPVEMPPSDTHTSFYRKARLGLHASESDDEPMTDSMPEELMSKKSRRLLHPTTSDEVVPDHGSTLSEDGKDPSSRVKFMCSFGGKIFPRPVDGKLRYVGGDTKIIAVHRDTTFLELIGKMRDVYGQALTFKYQLPDEDLDALVSVSSDEDLQNMMEEYAKLESCDGSSRLRVFLFPALDYDSSFQHKDSSGDLRNSEQRYVDAVNGIQEVGPRGYAGGGAPSFGLDNLLGLDGPETWNLPRGPDTVPVALLAPQIAHDIATHIHRVPVAVPVSSMPNRSNAPSAPSSAPSSPPLLPRPALAKLPGDGHLQYHQDAHVKLGPQYNVLVSEGNYQDSESYGGSGGSSSASQHDSLYRSTDSRRGPESPPRKQHEGGHQDHALRSDQRRIPPEQKVSRVGSHGKLTRLMEHVELAPSSTGEIQQMAEAHLPDMQRILQHQHQQQSHHQWQHPMDNQQETYRRTDMHQSTMNQNAVLGQQQQGYQQQQHQSTHFRPGLSLGVPSHDGVYRQGDQLQYPDDILHQLSRPVSSHTVAPGVASVQNASYHVGSDPSSPRVGYRDVSSRHLPGQQQLPIHWPYSGNAFPEQPPYVRRVNYGDQSARSFRLSNSPPKFREHLGHAEERLLRQQQTLANLVNSESYHLDQVPKSSQQLLYENNPVSQSYDLLSRPQVPLYKGLNPFQEKMISYQDHQEISEARRHQIPQQGQQHLHALHQNQRHDYDYQDPMLQSMEQMSGHPRYQETQHKVPKVAEWDSDEARLGFRSRPRMPLDDDLLVDAGVAHHADIQQAGYPGLHLPETSDDLLAVPGVGDYTGGHIKSDRLDHHGSSAFQFRPGMLPPSALSGYSGPKSRTSLPDPSLVPLPRYVGRTNDPEYLAPGGPRAGGNNQDPRPSLFDLNGHQHTAPAVGQGLQLLPPHRLVEERPASAFNPVTQQMQILRLGDSVMPNSETRWNPGLGPDDPMTDPLVTGRDLLGSLCEDRIQGLQNLAVGRVGRLSRPPSASNIPSLHEEDLGEVIHLLPYGTQRRSSSLIDEDPFRLIPAIENPLFTSNASKYSNPTPSADTMPLSSTGMFLFDPTPTCSMSSEYNNLTVGDAFPNIKTIATQVPSIEGDRSGASSNSAGGSVCSSNHGSGDRALGQLTMTQHLAEDMASCVLGTSPDHGASLPEAKPEHDHEESAILESQPLWPLEPEPTLSPNLWEKALDEAVLSGSANNDENDVQEGFAEHTGENIREITAEDLVDKNRHETLSHIMPASIAKDEEQEEHLAVKKKKSSEKNIADAAADEAIAHGLQTIKNADLEELRELGSGTFGTVYHGKWRGTDVAIKRIKASCFAGRPSEQERLIADFWREACNLGNLHHPNVVAFYGVVADGPGGTLATVTEYMVNGSLKQVLQKKDRTIDRRKRLMIAMDAAFGMEYLHGKNIVHFDLKCENLLVNMRDPHRPICKVGDLGLSKVKHQTMVSGGVRGTLPWMAPELLNGSSSLVTEKVDVFSFGIAMWELLTGEEPYANMHYGAIIGGIVNNSLRPPVPTWCDPAWRSLMERCWTADPASRPSFSEVASELRAMSDSLKPKTQIQSQGQHV